MKTLLAGGIAGLLLLMVGCGMGEENPLRDLVKDVVGEGDKEAQKKTVADIRLVGTAMFSWLTDSVGAGAAGQQEALQVTDYKIITAAGLEKLLVPDYIAALPLTDGWGNPYEYYVATDDLLTRRVLLIRSPGRDGKFSLASYSMGSFDPELFDEDIVWADGFFFRWPQKSPEGS